MSKCKRCGATIRWDPSRKTEKGKWIPIDDETGEPHDCPESDYNSLGSGNREMAAAVDVMSNSITNLENDIAKINKNVLKLIVEVQTLQKRVEGQMPLTFGMSAPEPNSNANPSSTSGNHMEDDSNADLST